jgi:hypothetical protein
VRIAAALILSLSSAAGAQDLPVDQVNWRYDEDWSVLGSSKTDNPPWWLRLKYLPLNVSGSNWISLGVDARLRHEGFRDNNWGSAGAPDDGYLWLRFMPHVDAHFGPARVFVQGIASSARGVAGGSGPVDSTGIDLLQGFADVRIPLTRGASVTVRAGRELMPLGTERHRRHPLWHQHPAAVRRCTRHPPTWQDQDRRLPGSPGPHRPG